MTSSSISISDFEFRAKARSERLISLVGVHLTRVILKGYNSKSEAISMNFDSSLKGIITEKIPFSDNSKSAA